MIAIEYPPFTSSVELGNGTAFILLANALRNSDMEIEPRFLPPARANRLVFNNAWCASFYPPVNPTKKMKNIGLSAESVKIGLYRLRQEQPLEWRQLADLEGKVVAVLRGYARNAIGKELVDAGVNILYMETVAQGFKLLLKKRVDFVFSDSTAGAYIIEQGNINPDTIQFSETLLFEIPVNIWLNRSCEAGNRAFEYLKKMKLDVLH